MAYVNRWTVRNGWVTSSTITPSGVTPGNLLIAGTSLATSNVAVSTGWQTIIYGAAARQIVYRIADGTADDTLVVTHDSAQYSKIVLLEVSGVDQNNPISTANSIAKSRWAGGLGGIFEAQPHRSQAADAGFAVAFLGIASGSLLVDRYSPSVGTEYTYHNLHAAVLPSHAAGDEVEFSWVQDNGSVDDVYPHTSFLVLINAPVPDNAPSAYLGGKTPIKQPSGAVQLASNAHNCVALFVAHGTDNEKDAITLTDMVQRKLSGGYEAVPGFTASGPSAYAPTSRSGYVFDGEAMGRIPDLENAFSVSTISRPFSFLWSGYLGAGSAGSIFGRRFSSGAGEWYISRESSNRVSVRHHTGAAEILTQSDTNILSSDTLITIAGKFASGVFTIYVNGRLAINGISGALATENVTSTRRFHFGATEGSFNGLFDTHHLLNAYFDADLSDDTLRDFSINPWQIIKPKIRTIFYADVVTGLTLTAINPTTGPSTGGTTVMMTGTGFEAGTVPKFNGVDATSVTIVSDTELTCVTPAI